MDAIRMNTPITEAYKSMLKAGKPAVSNAPAKDKKSGCNKSVKQGKKNKTAVMGKPKMFTKPKMKVMKENETDAEPRDKAEVLEELNAVSTLAQMLDKMIDYGIDIDTAMAKISLAITDLELFQPVLEKVVKDIDEEIEFEDEEAEASAEELENETEEIEAEEEETEDKE